MKVESTAGLVAIQSERFRLTRLGLERLASKGRLASVRKVPSSQYVGIQIADLLTGAINAAHSLKLNPNLPIHPGKRLAIEQLAELLGWDDLCYDTMPSEKFNIWHFPL